MTLNKSCYSDNDQRRIHYANTVVNVRGIDDSIAPKGQVGNPLFILLSDKFDDPYSLSNIAKTIRQSIIQLRDPKILGPAVAKIDQIIRTNIQNKTSPNPTLIQNEFAINSNYRFDWADQVDFGYKDRTRFYTLWTGALYLRAFRLNPEKEGNNWLPRDHYGAQGSFRLEKHLKERFLNAVNKDISENFENIS
jgi:hypothetical protein